MYKDFMLCVIRDYLDGKITRSELSYQVKKRRSTMPFSLLNYCSYSDLVLDGIQQRLSTIPEESYCDDDLKYIVGVLEEKNSIQESLVYVIPNLLINDEIRKLIKISEKFLNNYENGKTYPIQFELLMTNGEAQYSTIDSYFTREDYDFCEKIRNKLSNDTLDSVIKSMVWNLISIINRFVGAWEKKTTYFSSPEAISNDVFAEDMKTCIQALCGKRPIYMNLTGTINRINAVIIL